VIQNEWSDIDSLELSVRTANAIRNRDCKSIDDICAIPSREWLRIPNFGKKSLNELKEALWYQFHRKLNEYADFWRTG
jgi:DNA-directed RNA polymerase subunit alpha